MPFLKIFLCFLVLVDMGLNGQISIKKLCHCILPYNWYNANNPSYEKAIVRFNLIDESFYRTKVDSSLVTSPNESLRYKYKGMSIYTSTGNAENNMFLSKLGYPANTRAVSMENGNFFE